MNKLFLTFCFVAGALLSTNAQDEKSCCKAAAAPAAQNAKGDWYVGTGDISNLAWTQWSVSPSLGYAFTDEIMAGFSLSQGTEVDSTGATAAGDLNLDVHARYFFKDFFGYVGTRNLTTDFGLDLGVGKLFTVHHGSVFLDPRVVYNTNEGTINLRVGLGLKF
jgi:hypothetical protein